MKMKKIELSRPNITAQYYNSRQFLQALFIAIKNCVKIVRVQILINQKTESTHFFLVFPRYSFQKISGDIIV